MENANEECSRKLRDEAAGALALYDYLARLFLDPVPVPGTTHLVDLHERTSLLFGGAPNEGDDTGVPREMAAWITQVAQLRMRPAEEGSMREKLEDEQRLVAADRTQLCRGTHVNGPLPPYEEYYAVAARDETSGDTPASTAAAAYRQAGVHPDEQHKERADYAGTELAFLAYLARRELEAYDQEDLAEAAAARKNREAFERAHLPWMGVYADAALPHACTLFWQGALHVLKAMTN